MMNKYKKQGMGKYPGSFLVKFRTCPKEAQDAEQFNGCSLI